MHDKNGHPLQVGDRVTIEAVIQSASENPDFCNLSLVSVEPMYPGTAKTYFSLNAKQVVYVEPDIVPTPSLDQPVISAL